jgi:hypothetical protein
MIRGIASNRSGNTAYDRSIAKPLEEMFSE